MRKNSFKSKIIEIYVFVFIIKTKKKDHMWLPSKIWMFHILLGSHKTRGIRYIRVIGLCLNNFNEIVFYFIHPCLEQMLSSQLYNFNLDEGIVSKEATEKLSPD